MSKMLITEPTYPFDTASHQTANIRVVRDKAGRVIDVEQQYRIEVQLSESEKGGRYEWVPVEQFIRQRASAANRGKYLNTMENQ